MIAFEQANVPIQSAGDDVAEKKRENQLKG
jgi:hypothetical protein